MNGVCYGNRRKGRLNSGLRLSGMIRKVQRNFSRNSVAVLV